MNKFVFKFLRKRCLKTEEAKIWLKHTENIVSDLSLRRGQRAIARMLFRKMREIRCRFSYFYVPYAKQISWFDAINLGSTEPENLLLATRWLIKKHASISAEFRALETSLSQVSFDEIAPANLIETGFLLDSYVEQTAFRFSEETLANTLNKWQEKRGSPLSLSETESISPILRLLSLDKLSLVAVQLTEIEMAREEAMRFLEKFGSNQKHYKRTLERIRKTRGEQYANIFSETFAGMFSKTEIPHSHFRENEILIVKRKETKTAREPEIFRDISMRTRVLLRSLSLFGEFEWNTLLKKTNTLHRILIRDPAGVYAHMTTLSQEVYRKKAASLAKMLRLSEESLAHATLSLAKASNESPKNHIGFYLIDDGLPTLIRRLTGQSKLSWWHWYHDRKKLPLLQKGYFFSIFLFFVILLSISYSIFAYSFSFTILILFVAFPLFYKASKHITDSFFISVIPSTPLPRLNFRRSFPETLSAVFVIPAFLKDTKTLRSLLGKLETAYLSNRNIALSFCLLLDHPDADRETLPEDEPLLKEARLAFQELNARYHEVNRFSFFLRSRIWSPQQERWMGWERKRGKLIDFARILRNRNPSSPFLFSSVAIPKADFVITLDEDAFIPRDFIRNLLGVHAHPLHLPVFRDGKIERGYTFIQPHVKQWFANRHRFRLPRIFFDEKHFSMYSNVFPEIYQDVFSEGSYAGKGSFHVDSFLATLDGTLPTDQILSHDLLEGSLARSAFVSDIDVFDEFPKSLHAFLSRNHRWTRGDWQITDWLFGYFRDERHTLRANPLNFVNRFKIADNLLNSLFRPSVFTLTLFSWAFENIHLLLFAWTLFLFDLFLFDISIDWTRWFTQIIFGSRKHGIFRFRKTIIRSARLFRRAFFECVVLPSTAINTLHAIGTAIFRRFWSGKHMLEWVPSANSENSSERKSFFFPIGILLLLLMSTRFGFTIHPILFTIFVFWMTLPFIVFALNHPYRRSNQPSSEEKNLLRRDALETWSFFSDTVCEKTHFLPPDYIRLEPSEKTAEYTSITNIGFLLLSILTAHKLGFISRNDAKQRLDKTIQTLEHLETYKGHFYNWYNIQTAQSAPPPFISSVDSGNLLASLIVTLQWLSIEKGDHDKTRAILGLRDMTRLIRDRIPKTLEMQTFADFWDAIVERVDNFSPECSPEIFAENCLAIETSISGMTIFKHLPIDIERIFKIFRDRINEAVTEYGSENSEKNKEFSASVIDLRKRLESLIARMRFEFLRSNKCGLLSVGLHVPTRRLEPRFYQTLASEARIANMLALAEGTLSFRAWNKLNRTVVALAEGPTLISWTGTLFEYLMPTIFLEEHDDSLVGRSVQTAIRMNRRFSRKRKVPVWGLSESAYAEFDRGGNFRYKPFGIPTLALSPLVDSRPVFSAYNSALSLPFFLGDALKNLATYTNLGGKGMYGYIEAIDFHRSRHGLPIRMFMSHHQGMIITAIGNCLFDRFLSRLFESHPLIQNSLFVIDEGIPPIDKEPFPRPAPVYLKSAIAHPRTP